MSTPPPSTLHVDLLIIGAGPAGLVLATQVAALGVDVAVVDPDLHEPFTNNYGTWVDEWPGDLLHVLDRRWNAVDVRAEGQHEVERAYAGVDGAALHGELVGRCREAGVRFVPGKVEALVPLREHTRIEGPIATARLVVDATGSGRFIEAAPATAFQVAYGQWLRVSDHPWATDRAVLMDFSTAHLAEAEGPPTFLYVLPEDAEHVFVEETSLASEPPVSMEVLRERLARRLEHLGVHGEVLAEERCRIPMNGGIPDLSQQTLAYGASAGFVHPASGYQLARCLTRAPAVAEALTSALELGDPQEGARQAWRAIWPREARAVRALQQLGLEVLLSLDAAQTRAFFDRFFRFPVSDWAPFLGDADLVSTSRSMLTLFLAGGSELRSPILWQLKTVLTRRFAERSP